MVHKAHRSIRKEVIPKRDESFINIEHSPNGDIGSFQSVLGVTRID